MVVEERTIDDTLFILPILGDKGFDEPSSNEWSNNICQANNIIASSIYSNFNGYSKGKTIIR